MSNSHFTIGISVSHLEKLECHRAGSAYDGKALNALQAAKRALL